MRWPWPNDSKQLTRIERKVDQIVSSIGDLDAKLDQLGTEFATLRTDVEALIAAIPPGNFVAEIQKVQDSLTSIEQTTAEVTAATPPPPPPPGG